MRENNYAGLTPRSGEASSQGGASAPTPPNRHPRPYAFWVLALVCMLILCFLFPIPASAHGDAGTGRINGRLLNGTRHNAPVAGQSVTLQMAQGDTARDLTSVTTDAHGMFSFSGLHTDKTINYAVYTLYQGAQYYTDLIDLSSKPVQQVNLTVYEATTSTANLAIVQVNLLVDKVDAQAGLITIAENFFFENLGVTSYVGSLQANGGKPNALRFSLPKGARHLSLSSGFNGYQMVQVDAGFATNAAVPPGTSQFAFSFQVPYTSSNYDFSSTVVYPTLDLSLLVPLDYHVSSAVLASKGTVNANQRTYQQFRAQRLLVGAEIHAELDGLPVPSTAASPSPISQNTLWFIAAVVIMVTIVAVTLFVYGLTRRRVPGRSRRKRTASREAARRPGGERSSASSKARAAPEDQEQALLQELLELDKAYEAGKIKKAEYEERRAQTKARLRSLMNAEPAGRKEAARRHRRSV